MLKYKYLRGRTMNNFNKFCNGIKCSEKEFLEAYEYYKNMSNDTEKQRFERITSFFGMELIRSNEDKYEKIKKLYARKYGLPENFIPFLMATFIKQTTNIEDLLKYIKIVYKDIPSFLKKLYDECEEAGWDKAKISEISSSYHFCYEGLWKLIKYYMIEVLGKTLADYQKKREASGDRAPKCNSNKTSNGQKYEPKQITDILYVFGCMLLEDASFNDIKAYVLDNKVDYRIFIKSYIEKFASKYYLEHSTPDKKVIEERVLLKAKKFVLDYKNERRREAYRKTTCSI